MNTQSTDPIITILLSLLLQHHIASTTPSVRVTVNFVGYMFQCAGLKKESMYTVSSQIPNYT